MVSKSQQEAVARYKAKVYKRIPLDVRNEEYKAIKEYADRTGESVNGFIRRIIKEKIGVEQ